MFFFSIDFTGEGREEGAKRFDDENDVPSIERDIGSFLFIRTGVGK